MTDTEAGAMETTASPHGEIKRTGTIKATRAAQLTTADDDNADRNQKILLFLLIVGGIAAFTIFILGTLDLNKSTGGSTTSGAGDGQGPAGTLAPELESYYLSIRFNRSYASFPDIDSRHNFGKAIASVVAAALSVADTRVRSYNVREGSTIVDLQITPPLEGSAEKNAVDLAALLATMLSDANSDVRKSPAFADYLSEGTGGGSATAPPVTLEPTQAGETKLACTTEPHTPVNHGVAIGAGCVGTRHGGACSFRCEPGYELTSLVAPLCDNGAWVYVPSCVASRCEVPTLTHGSATPLTGSTGSQTTYSCTQGYTLVGEAVATCMPDRRWSDNATSPRVCAANPCSPDLVSPANGFVSSETGVTGDVRTYSCQGGYQVVGNVSTTCTVAGTWSFPAPTCEAQACTGQPVVPNSVGTCGTIAHGQRCANVTCGASYSQVGPDPLCEFGAYTSVPTCDPNDCNVNPPIANANFTSANCSGTDAGSTCNVPCFKGYEISPSGPPNATCGVGSWVEPLPACVAKDCPPVASVLKPNSRVLENATVGYTGDSRTVVCHSGFDMTPAGLSLVVECTPNPDEPDWLPATPTCFPKDCPPLVAPMNGSLSIQATHATAGREPVAANAGKFGDIATYACNTGFSLFGSSPVRTCTMNPSGAATEWSPLLKAPTCTPNPCAQAIVLNNTTPASPSCVGSPHATVCAVECTTGFALTGPAPRCYLGNWIGTSRCEFVPTPAPTPVPTPPVTVDSSEEGIFGFVSSNPKTSGAIALAVGLLFIIGFASCCCMICRNMKRTSKRVG